MNYRKLWLINALGERYDLTDNSNVFLNIPEGFGLSRSYSSIKIGNSEKLTSQQFNLIDVTGELLFYKGSNGDKYNDYQSFIQFIKFKPLELHYQTPNVLEDDSWYSEVLITSIQKGEISQDGILHCPITFHRLTEWLTNKDFLITLVNNPIGTGKSYPYTYPYHYRGSTLSETTINNQGTDDVGFILQIDGYVENPSFSITQEGDTYGVCKINGNYTKVIIDSVEKDDFIYLESNGAVVPNPHQYQDHTIANGKSAWTWCKFRVGESTFNFTCGNIDTFDGIVTISFKNSYTTV